MEVKTGDPVDDNDDGSIGKDNINKGGVVNDETISVATGGNVGDDN